jgi:hypothetical protein
MKKATRPEEQSRQRKADYTDRNNAHVQFIQNELFPSLTRQAHKEGVDPTAVALCAFLSLSSALENNGLPRALLAQLVAAPPVDAPPRRRVCND